MTRRVLAGRHAVVTGGSRGIGLAIANALVDSGANVTLMARDAARLDTAIASLRLRHAAADGSQAQSFAAAVVDVADESSVNAAFAATRAANGPIDILINNAGVAESAPFTKTSADQFQRLLDINLRGVWLCTQAFATELPPSLRADDAWRHVVNVASTAALKGYAYVAAYCAAKHGVLGLTRALAHEWARRRVAVNAVCPGYTDTDIVAAAVANITAKTGRDAATARAELARSNPQAQLVTPEQVANAVLWLVSPGAESINGQAISVSGGEI
ncbi:MAG: SDR family oxidoreductase [Burkholderiales bacterium]|nr:SDR family oxidoreductase [Burkholderiales bacterium]